MSTFSWSSPGGRRVLVFANFVSFACLFMPESLSWYWANLVICLDSFWHAQGIDFSVAAPLVMSTYLTSWAVSLLLAGYLILRVDSRIILLVGILLHDSGIFLSRLSVEHSTLATIVTLGVMPGAGLGFIDTEILTRVPKLIETRIGMSLAIVQCFLNVGAILIDVIITWYANPNNEKADVKVYHMKIFSVKSVIDQVPSLFLVLGTAISACHIVGVALTLFFPPHLHDDTQPDLFTESPPKGRSEEFSERLTLHQEGELMTKISQKTPAGDNHEIGVPDRIQDHQDSSFTYGWNEKNSLLSESQRKERKRYSCDQNSGNETSHKKSDNGEATTSSTEAGSSNKSCSSYVEPKPGHILKKRCFYAVWFSYFVCESSNLVLVNFYKVFSELWIHDDHFLTVVAVVSLISVAVSRIIWGAVSDRMRVKDFQVITISLMSVCCFFYAFTARVNQWLFAAWTCIVYSINGHFYVNLKLATYKLFGKSHLGFNYGLVISSCILLNTSVPFVMASLLRHMGWFAVYGGVGVLNLVALLLNFFLLPNQP